VQSSEEGERMEGKMKVAVGQFRAAPGEVQANLERVRELAAEAAEKKAQILVLPETMDWGYGLEGIRSGFTHHQQVEAFLQKASKDFHLLLVAGIVAKENDSIRNRQLICFAGKTIAFYDKIHLFSLGEVREQQVFVSGTSPNVFSWGDISFGSLICFDLRFPELTGHLRLNGAKVFLVNSAWPSARSEAFRTLSKARAIENQCFLLSANQSGEAAGLKFAGGSMIVAPDGRVLAELSEESEGIAAAEIDFHWQEELRSAMPVSACRRPDIYPLTER
jgi:omega-amidase